MVAKIKSWGLVSIIVLLGGLCLVGLGYASVMIWYWERIYPGVRIGSIDVGGMTRKQAGELLEKKVGQIGDLRLSWNNYSWGISYEDLSLEYDIAGTVKGAFGVGRVGNPIEATLQKWVALDRGIRVEPEYKYDKETLEQVLGQIQNQINIPVKEPSFDVQWGVTPPVVNIVAGRDGQRVEIEKLQKSIDVGMTSFELGQKTVPVMVLKPKFSPSDVEGMKSRVLGVYSKKIVVQAEQLATWEALGEQLVAWLDPKSMWNANEIQLWIQSFAKEVDREPQNAFFRYSSGKVEEFKPGSDGVVVDQQKLFSDMLGVLSALETGTDSQQKVEARLIKKSPNINTRDVNDLGIVELIGRGESRFTGSIPNRVFNLKKAAENMDGVLIAPGEVFSFNKYVGDISAAGGYKQGYIIKDGKTILGDGGGVCQSSSTMFRAALNAGLPIEERWAHAYRVSYYEQDIGPGYDATIFTPSVDLKWKNDTTGYILIQTKFDGKNSKLAFELYGTSDGRRVELSKSRVWDRVAPPPPLYQEDPTLPAGTSKKVEHGIYGSKVAFDWIVTRDGEVLQKRTFFSNYTPWQEVNLVGTRI